MILINNPLQEIPYLARGWLIIRYKEGGKIE
jgi:hypothetical protein